MTDEIEKVTYIDPTTGEYYRVKLATPHLDLAERLGWMPATDNDFVRVDDFYGYRGN